MNTPSPYLDTTSSDKPISTGQQHNLWAAIHKHPEFTAFGTATLDPMVLKIVGNNITALLKSNNLKSCNELVTWNNIYKCLEYQVTISGPSTNPTFQEIKDRRLQPSLEGRVIKVRIFNKESSLQQSGHDYVNRLNNLANSGIDLIKKFLGDEPQAVSYIKEIEAYHSQLAEKLILLNPANKKQHELAIEAFQSLNTKIAHLLFSLQQSHQQLITAKLTELDYINSTLDRTCTKGHPINPKDWLKILEIHEARFDIEKKREVFFHLYQDPANIDSNSQKLWLINSNIPFSDIPSTLRNAAGKILPNWFRSNTKVLQVSNGKCEIVDSFTAERSSSISALSIAKTRRQEYTKQIAENKLRLLVRNKIIAKLNQLNLNELDFNNPEHVTRFSKLLKNCFNQQTMIMTLLNLPFKHKYENILPEAFSEFPQFKAPRAAFHAIADKPLYLEQSDIDYIVSHVNVDNIVNPNKKMVFMQELISQLNSKNDDPKPIIHKEVFHNFASSGLRFLSREDKYNRQALSSIVEFLREFLEQHKITTTDINFKSLTSLRQLYSTPNIPTAVKKPLSLYIKYLELLKTGSNAAEDNFLRQVFTALLMNSLHKEIHITCKSGEDRTGAIFVAIDCALLALARTNLNSSNNFNIHDPTIWAAFKEDFWKHYVALEQLSPSREITNFNAIGARGLQSQNKKGNIIMRTISPIYQFFSISDKMARISKLAFKNYLSPKKLTIFHRKLNSIPITAHPNPAASSPKREVIFRDPKPPSLQKHFNNKNRH